MFEFGLCNDVRELSRVGVMWRRPSTYRGSFHVEASVRGHIKSDEERVGRGRMTGKYMHMGNDES